jgi:hypothetical protein
MVDRFTWYIFTDIISLIDKEIAWYIFTDIISLIDKEQLIA